MKTNPKLTRQQIIQSLQQALEAKPYVYAMWEAGSAAFGRIDDWSDIDLHVDVADEHVSEVFQTVESVLAELSPIELKYEVPQPTWHGLAQTLYRLQEAGEFAMVDLAVVKHSNPHKFLESELHGQARVLFDRAEVIQVPPLDWEALESTLRTRLDTLRITFDLFQRLVIKEIYRQNPMDAFAFYQRYTIGPLVEVLRMKFQPARYQFGMRYLYYDLPMETARELQELVFVYNLDDLEQKYTRTAAWFDQVWQELHNNGPLFFHRNMI